MPTVVKDKKSRIVSNILAPIKERLLFVKYLIDFILIICCYWLSYFIRFEGAIPPEMMHVFKITTLIFVFGFVVCDFSFGLAKGIWRYVSIRDLEKVLAFILAGNGLTLIIGFVVVHEYVTRVPRSIYIINSFLLFFGISGARVLHRVLYEYFKGFKKEHQNVLIVGDRDIAASVQHSILKDQGSQFRISGFITFNKNNLGSTINATPVIGMLKDVPRLVKDNNVQYIFIAVDLASTNEMRKIIKTAQQTGATVRITPTMFDIVHGKFSLNDLREIKFEDYLDRKPVRFEIDKIKDEFEKRSVLVTGGGGSIGSSICRELLRLRPSQLIIVDISENNLFKISCELSETCKKYRLGGVDIVCRILDIRNNASLDNIFSSYKPDYVIHAAALKHVPLSEENVIEAISTNVCGTLNLIAHARKFSVKKFIYISTDKAVEPISIMGATKRVGELMVKASSEEPGEVTKFIAVRFGNVIGSSGNVIESFIEHLQQGKQICLTDARMERYFMSLNEATKLIIQSISAGSGGEIFVLDMGSPVKIKDLAYDMALYYGKHLKDSDIVYTGKRKGEKIKEKLLSAGEIKKKTIFDKILKVEEKLMVKDLDRKVEELCACIAKHDEKAAKKSLFSIVPTLREDCKDGSCN
ncbi:polysaccharide biosynthesis protein [Candidatus Omnitrophota bacterium]